ncbi:hypothetical protein WA158_005783 [Blastocystis sp. Blastoise]
MEDLEEENPIAGYLLSFNGIIITIISRNWKLIWLPFAYCIFGFLATFIDAAILSATLAALYISIPYSLSNQLVFSLAICHAVILCYLQLGRDKRLSKHTAVF